MRDRQRLLSRLLALAYWLVLWCGAGVAVDSAVQMAKPAPGFRVEPPGYVSPLTPEGWPGPRAGLRPYDRVVAVDGRPVGSPATLGKALSAEPAPRTVSVSYTRGGAPPRTLSLPYGVMPPASGWGALAPLFGAALAAVLAGVLLHRARPWQASALTLSWACLYFGALFLGLIDLAWGHRAQPILRFLLPFCGAVIAHLAWYFPFPAGKPARRRAFVALGYGAAAIVGLLRVVPPAHDLWLVWVGLLLAAMVAFGVRQIVTLCRPSLPARTGSEAFIALVGLLCALLPLLGAYLVPVLTGHPERIAFGGVQVGLVMTAALPLSLAFASFRYEIFGRDAVARRSLVSLLTMGGIFLALMGLAWTLHETLPDDPWTQMALGLAVLMAALPFLQPLQRLIVRRLNPLGYDSASLAADFAEFTTRPLSAPALFREFRRVIQISLAPSVFRLVHVAPATGRWEELDPTPGAGGRLLLGHGEGRWCPARWQPATAVPAEEGDALFLIDDPERSVVLFLGPRKGGAPYLPEDWRFLEALARQAGIWLQFHGAMASLTEKNAELHEANLRLQRLEDIKRDFLNNTSHELRTPLSTIMGFAEFLEDGLGGPLTSEQAAFVQQIQGGAKRLRRLVDDMIDAACLNAGVFELALQEVEIGALVARVADAMQPQAREVGVTLAVLGTWPEFSVEGDPTRLEQILVHLIDNALKFTPEGGKVTLTGHCGLERCEVRVADTGIGIAPEHQARLFEKFYQVDPGLSRAYGGTGLGLALARGLTEAHHGALTCVSHPGEGSTFVLTLPRRHRAAAEAPASQVGALQR